MASSVLGLVGNWKKIEGVVCVLKEFIWGPGGEIR